MKGTLSIDVDDFIKILGKPASNDSSAEILATVKRIEKKLDDVIATLKSSQKKIDAAGEAIADNTEKLEEATK